MSVVSSLELWSAWKMVFAGVTSPEVILLDGSIDKDPDVDAALQKYRDQVGSTLRITKGIGQMMMASLTDGRVL